MFLFEVAAEVSKINSERPEAMASRSVALISGITEGCGVCWCRGEAAKEFG